MRAGRGDVFLAVVSLVISGTLLLLAEGAARRLDPGYIERLHDNSVDRLNAYSEIYGWAPRPGGRARERGLETVLNDQGHRGPLVPLQRGGRPRLVLIGDSTAFGYGVAEDVTYARRLESEGLEVVNLGVLGYGPDQALIKLEREGLAYSPDVVVLSFCIDNDFADARSPVYLYDGRHPKPFFTLAAGRLLLHDEHLRLSAPERLGLWLVWHSQLYARLLATLPTPATPVPKPWRARRAALLADKRATLELMLALVVRMRDDAAAHEARFLVMAHPGKDAYNRGSELWRALAARLAQRQVAILDLGQGYHRRGLHYSELALDPTGHLSAAGHAVAAGLLLERLRSDQQLATRD